MCNKCGNNGFTPYNNGGCCGSNNDGCGCSNNCDRYRDNRPEALRNLEFDVLTVRCGIKDLKKGISMIRSGCVCDGIQKLKTGACNMEMGINNLISRFESGCFEVGCKSKRLIDEAICSLKEAICLVYQGIEAIENGCIEEGIAKICRAICNAEEGLADLEKALARLC